MKTIKNLPAYVQAIRKSLKEAWNSDEAIEITINQIKNKPEVVENTIIDKFAHWRTVLKKAWKTDSEIDFFINHNIKDKTLNWERFSNTHIKFSAWLFSFIYPDNATAEQKEKLIIKALKEYQTK